MRDEVPLASLVGSLSQPQIFTPKTNFVLYFQTLIENKRFPQQRFSPVQKQVNSADVTYRPKPIKMKPESPIRAELIRQVRHGSH